MVPAVQLDAGQQGGGRAGQAGGRRVLQHAQAAGHRLELRAGKHGQMG